MKGKTMKTPLIALSAWALCLGTVAIAAETTTTTTTTSKSGDGQVVIIKSVRQGARPADPKVPVHCDGGKQEVSTTNDGAGKRVHIMMCTDEGASPADIAARLSEARKHVAEDGNLSANARAKVLKELDSEIERNGGKAGGAQ
jgi:NADH dehydrogenase/NADH:ubiquinone oxidoreductase subunit G